MNHPRRLVITALALTLGCLGFAGVAAASSYGEPPNHSEGGGCIPENDHSSTDLYRYPNCDGHRDIRDDEPKAGPERRGLVEDMFHF